MALGLWDEVANSYPDSKYAIISSIYAEAVRGPQSIPALEAAHELGKLRQNVMGNFAYALFLN